MRNKFEHYDEKLDEWWTKSKNHMFLDQSVLSPNAVQGFKKNEMFRVLDPATMQLVFWGDTFDLRAVIAEIQRLLPAVVDEAHKPHWET